MTMKINSSLFNIPIINSVIEYDCTDSTNERAKVAAKRGSVHGTLFVAHRQISGKGRLGRTFDSEKDQGLYFSLLLRPHVNPKHLSNITLLTAVAITRALKRTCQVNPLIKWPNDILLNHKKLAGILTEAGSDYVIIGIGLNTRKKCFSPDLADTATSLFLETSSPPDDFTLLYNILQDFGSLFDDFVTMPDFGFLSEEYNQNLASLNNLVYLIPHETSCNSSNPYEINTCNLTPFFCKGIDKNGFLLCEDSEHQIFTVNSGEISLRSQSSNP